MFFDYIELLSFERPLLLIFALQPVVILFFTRLKIHSLSQYSDKSLWPWSINISEQHFRSRNSLRFIAWLLLAIAMSGPILPGFNNIYSEHDKNIKSDISIMIIADVNGILKEQQSSYLIQLSDFIDNLQGEKIGFVSLTYNSSLISPLTNDYEVSSFYLRQMFKIVNFKTRNKSVGFYKSLLTSYKEIKRSQASTGIIIYWSDFKRNKLKSTELIKSRIILEEMEGEKIKVFPVWNANDKVNIDSSDIEAKFGDSAYDYEGMTIQELYQDSIADIKSDVIFDSKKDYGYQQLYAKPLILGLLLLLISFIPYQQFKLVRK